MKEKMSKPQLVVAGGDWESVSAALNAGADAIFFGTKDFNLRINAKSFELNQIPKIVERCHQHNARAYLTLNAIIYQHEIGKVERVLRVCRDAKVDAVICWDHAVIAAARRIGVPVHLSTQASVSNFDALSFYYSQGIKRVVLARECSLHAIAEIKKKIAEQNMDITLEAFAHGAMCVSISGRCFISEYLFGHSANRGDCFQPCRREYAITDVEEGSQLHVSNGYVLSPNDLCTVDIIDQLIESGIGAFKIEGRTRACDYVSKVTSVYREAIDLYFENKLTPEVKERFVEELKTVYYRGFSHGFYCGVPRADLSKVSGSLAKVKKDYCGEVIHYFKKIDVAEILLRNADLAVGDQILFTGKTTGSFTQTVEEMQLNHEAIQSAEKGSRVAVKTTEVVRVGDKVFRLN